MLLAENNFRHAPLEGIIPPLITPLLDAGTIDLMGLDRLLERVQAGGVHGLFILGTTGEGASLTLAVKTEFVRLVCERVRSLPILVNVTSTAVDEVLELADCAAESGAAALVLAPPFYFPLTQDELYGYFERLIPQLPLPVYLYNYPQICKVPIELETLVRLRGIRKLVGLKDSSGDMAYLASVRGAFPAGSGFGIYCGPEEQLAEALQLGADGGIPGGANIFPGLYTDLFKAHRRDDAGAVASLQALVMEVSRGIYAMAGGYAGAVRGIKSALAGLGIGNGATAEPLGPLPLEIAARIAVTAADIEARVLEAAL